MTPAIHLGPAENNQSYSALTFECSTAEKLYKRIKTIKIRTPPIIPTHIHQADQLFSFLQLLQVFVTSKVGGATHVNTSGSPAAIPSFTKLGNKLGVKTSRKFRIKVKC